MFSAVYDRMIDVARQVGRISKIMNITRLPIKLAADPTRVITRLFLPGGEQRLKSVIDRVTSLSEDHAAAILSDLTQRFCDRHRDIRTVFERHCQSAEVHLNGRSLPSQAHRLLLGAYATFEYSLESVALFNPSMVQHSDQEGVPGGSSRFVMSVRACGEGHISSIGFRTGIVDSECRITVDPTPRFAMTEQPVAEKRYNKARYFRKLIEMGAYNPMADGVLDQLSDQFTIADLTRAMQSVCPLEGYKTTWDELVQNMLWLVHSNYHLDFPEDSDLAERVIFPITENESRGIEDARFVKFTDEDGSTVYYATYTAYNGFRTLPQLIETEDFRRFKIYTLNGKCVQNKGMAMFPRKIGGEYCMVSRLDGENMYILRSDSFHFWNESELLRVPVYPWEFVQIGNCGSPIETEEGWLLLTHGVGPMRQYWLGALLLDKENPAKVIGHMEEPWLMPDESERDGYVPNVVYSCGGMVHNKHLIVPYAASDSFIRIATVELSELLASIIRD